MKKFFMLLMGLMVSMAAMTSCDDDDKKDSLEDIENMIENGAKPSFDSKINKSDNKIEGVLVCKVGGKEVYNVKMVAEFEMGQSPTSASGAPVKMCKSCVMTQTFATEAMAKEAYEEMKREEGCSLKGKTITVDMSRDFYGQEYDVVLAIITQTIESMKI